MYSLVSGNETGHKEDAAEKTFLQMLWLVAGCRSCPDAKSGETAVKALRSATQSGNRKLNLHHLERVGCGAEA